MTKLNFVPRIESLRGLAALMVVSYHVSNQFQGRRFSSWLDEYGFLTISAGSNGIGAVVVFFVLSGFVLARSLDRTPSAFAFLRSRVFRLLPAASAVVALLTLLYWQFGIYVGYKASFDPLQVVLNMLMLRSDINGVMWSMTVECAGAVAELVGIEVGVVSGVINLESSGVEASDWRLRHEQAYHEARFLAACD